MLHSMPQPGANGVTIAIRRSMANTLRSSGSPKGARFDLHDRPYVHRRCMFGEMAKWVGQIDDIHRIPEYVAHAWHTCQAGRPGPVVLALPDNLISSVAEAIVPNLAPGTIVLILDAAAPFAGVLPERADITYFIGHPCHPPLYADLDDPAQRADVHGGVAPQAIVCALMQGPEEHYEIGRDVCEVMWAPIIRTHRVTTEQMAILEPGLSEMVAMPFVDAMIEAVDICADRYDIDRQAAFDFMIGHINVEVSMWFGFTPKVPSDAALRLMRFARGVVLRDDWERALDPKVVKEAAELIVNS